MSQSSVSIMSAKTWELTPYELQRTPQVCMYILSNTPFSIPKRAEAMEETLDEDALICKMGERLF